MLIPFGRIGAIIIHIIVGLTNDDIDVYTMPTSKLNDRVAVWGCSFNRSI